MKNWFKCCVLCVCLLLCHCRTEFWRYDNYYYTEWIYDDTGLKLSHYKFLAKDLPEFQASADAGIIGPIRGPFPPMKY